MQSRDCSFMISETAGLCRTRIRPVEEATELMGGCQVSDLLKAAMKMAWI